MMANNRDNQPQTQQGVYLKRMAEGGHFRQKLGETALALTECYCKGDTHSQDRLGSALVSEVRAVLTDVYGWSRESAEEAAEAVFNSFKDATI
jgi:hypothetical protein